MNTKYDLYITFAEPPGHHDKSLSEFIQQVITSLEVSLSRILGYRLSVAVKGRDFNRETASKVIRESALAVMFLHPSFEEDAEYHLELARICETFDITQESMPRLLPVFKVCLEPLTREPSPTCLNHLLSYDFFEKNRYTRRTKRLDFNSSERLSAVYGKILDLAYDIATQIRNTSVTASQEPKYAYLGVTTPDQQSAHDEIRRELLHFGFSILPSAPLPDTGEAFKNALEGYLEKSSLIVQLMGTQYGDVLKGTKYSVTDYQNQIIREFLEEHNDHPVRRLIWIPQNAKISDQRQALYLKRIRRDDAVNNSEIVESFLESFKSILADNLEKPTPTPLPDQDNISLVYLLTEEESCEPCERLYTTLSASGLKINRLDYTEQAGIYTRHLNALCHADAVVIYQQNENNYWLSSKLRDLVKSPGLGRKKPYKRIVIVTPAFPDAQLTRMIKSPVEIIHDQQASPETILNKLIAE